MPPLPQLYPCSISLISAEFRRLNSIPKLTLAMKINPPEIRQKAEINSEGGLEGYREVGGEI
jgi:hypothetical protein